MTNDSSVAPVAGPKKVKISARLIPAVEVDAYYDALREVALHSLAPADRSDFAATNFMGLIQSGGVQTWGIFEEGTKTLLGALFCMKSRDRVTGKMVLVLYGLHLRGAESIDEGALLAAWGKIEAWANREGCSRAVLECNLPEHLAMAERLSFGGSHRVMVKEIK